MFSFRLTLPFLVLMATAPQASADLLKKHNLSNGKQHLVFLDVWSIYQDSQLLTDLKVAKTEYQQVLIQPEMNITKAQLDEFVRVYDIKNPILLDKNLQLLRKFGQWKMPFHTLVADGEIVFQGDHKAYLAHVNKTPAKSNQVLERLPQSPEVKSIKRNIGTPGYLFTRPTITNASVSIKAELALLQSHEPLNLIFLDSLCPMPHFPKCEEKIGKLKEKINTGDDKWLGVVSSFYVDKNFVSDFLKRQQLSLNAVYDADNTIFRQYGVFASPYVVTLNNEGIITYRGEVTP